MCKYFCKSHRRCDKFLYNTWVILPAPSSHDRQPVDRNFRDLRSWKRFVKKGRMNGRRKEERKGKWELWSYCTQKVRAPPWRQAREGGGEEGQSDFPSNGRASRCSAAAGEPRPHLFHGSQQEQPTSNRCIAGAHPERHRECRGELKSFTSTWRSHTRNRATFNRRFPQRHHFSTPNPTETGHTRQCSGAERPKQLTNEPTRSSSCCDSTMPMPAKKQSIGPVLELNRSIHCVLRKPPNIPDTPELDLIS